MMKSFQTHETSIFIKTLIHTRRGTLRSHSHPRLFHVKSTARTDPVSTSIDLHKIDQLIKKGDDAQQEAVALATSLKDDGILRAFGTANQVPKRLYSLEELRLNKIDTRAFLSPEDTTLNSVRNTLQLSFLVGTTAVYLTGLFDFTQLVQTVILISGLLVADQVANAGGIEALLIDTAGRAINHTYARRVALHEAGHFLVAYLLGLLPKGYTLSSLDAYLEHRTFNVQAGTTFCDSDFQREISSGKLSSSSLDVYSCVALAGVVSEWLRFGKAEGGLADVQQLDGLMTALQFTQAKADAQVRWAVLNVVFLLRKHSGVQDALANAMMEKKSVGECIMAIEKALYEVDDI